MWGNMRVCLAKLTGSQETGVSITASHSALHMAVVVLVADDGWLLKRVHGIVNIILLCCVCVYVTVQACRLFR